ncbi:MAG: FeoB-associated Cys-rich membrane protein [Lachnospiraceae bacterium]|nr:FeoB-associated Cys-rich membrane protein [Lachnospiraceae bacterium]
MAVDIIALIVILIIVGAACAYIYKEKKKGTKCIGCPMAGNCKKHQHNSF